MLRSNLTNFPVLISIASDNDLRTTGNGGHVQQDPNGYDITFRASDGTTVLDHEVEKYDPATGQLVAWVRVPTLSYNSNTTLYLYYGNPAISTSQENKTGVWDSSYQGVWHLSSNNFNDSTSNGNNGSDSGTNDVAGQMANGRNFDANTDHISVGSSTGLQPANLTYSFWVRRKASWSGMQKVLCWFKGAVFDGNGWYVDSYDPGDQNMPLNLVVDGNKGFQVTGGIDPDTFYPLNTWTYVVVTFNSGTNAGAAYKNAVSQTFTSYLTPDSITPTADTKNLSSMAGETTSIIGDLDEVRVSNTVRSACWIQTEYNNQNAPGTFASPGAEQNIGSSVNLANHAAGQEGNKFTSGSSVSGAELFAFQLTNNTASTVTVTQVQFPLSSVTGIAQGDFANLALYVDANNDGAIGGGEVTTVGGSGVVNAGVTTLTFSTSFTIAASATVNFILKGDVSSLVAGDTVALALGTGNVTLQSGTMGGTAATNVTHSTYRYRKPITIDYTKVGASCSSNLTNFRF